MQVQRVRDAIHAVTPRLENSEGLRRFKNWFWLPPRPHGEVINDRTVSFLELLYDLVYVAVIGQATHHLAEHISGRAFGEFAVVFALIWIAWINGSFYLELHGREDGRTRLSVFLQMGILVLLAVFTADAAGEGGAAFAIVYTTFLLVTTWLWYTVRRQDSVAHPEFVRVVDRYVAGMSVAMIVILASTFLSEDLRLVVWAGFGCAWIAGLLLMAYLGNDLDEALPPTHSLVERFGLFTLVVLGEVVFGVVGGLSSAEQDFLTIVTGLLALSLGFGFWWVYFDLVGRRLPKKNGRAVVGWVMSHLPFTLSVAAAGAAMVGLIDHAHDASTPASTAWLLGGAVAASLAAQILVERALVDAERLPSIYRPLTVVMAGGAIAAVIASWTQPAPWLLALLLVGILFAVWVFAVSRFVRAEVWGET